MWNGMCAYALVVLIAGSAAQAEDVAPGGGNLGMDVSNLESCPVQILARKTRVVDPNSLSSRPHDAGREMYRVKGYGAVDRQFVFQLSFRNDSQDEIATVAFRWEAFDESDELVFERLSYYGEHPVGSGKVASLHDLELTLTDRAVRYRVSVMQAQFTNGSSWKAPPSESTTGSGNSEPDKRPG
jgi:hypothetical protein